MPMFMDSVAGSGPCRARFVEGVLQVLDDQGKWVNIRAGTRQDMGRSVSRHYPQADIGHAGAGSVLGDARGVSVSCVSFRNRTGQASPPLNNGLLSPHPEAVEVRSCMYVLVGLVSVLVLVVFV